MFKSTKEYNSAIYKVLSHICDNNTFPKPTSELDEFDLGDVVNLCNNRGYLDGIHVDKNAVGDYLYSGRPRITYQGLDFIEKFKAE